MHDIPRQAMSKADYDNMMRSRFYFEDSVKGTPEEDLIYDRHQALANALSDQVEAHHLSTMDDIYVLYDCFRTKIVFVNFLDGHQLLTEKIAFELLQNPQWHDFAVVLSAGGQEPMILDAEVEAITKDGIFAQTEAAAFSCGGDGSECCPPA